MKWHNKNNTQMINLDVVNGYSFISAKKYINEFPDRDDVNNYKMFGDRLELIICGTPYVFQGGYSKRNF